VFDRDPYHVIGYRGYGTATRALVLGRVLEDEGIVPGDAKHSLWQNLISTVKRIDSDPLPHARVHARMGDNQHVLLANDEGFLRDWMSLDTPVPQSGWHPVGLELMAQRGVESRRATTEVFVPPATAKFGVVSDLDDTVIQSKVTSMLSAARLLLLENARTRLPFPGVAAFYRALANVRDSPNGAAVNPVFYVSSNAWNMYDVVSDFLDHQRIPRGPVLLRDWDLSRALLRNTDHKTRHIHEILETYPALPFILVGDSGQEDPEIYSEVVRAYPGRILAIYIRDVSRHAERSRAIGDLARSVAESGSMLLLAEDTLAAAKHAAEQGWIDPATLGEISADALKDEGAR
jgi:phosphatidate phosphatase APP1